MGKPRLCLRQGTLAPADTRDLLPPDARGAREPRQGVLAEGNDDGEVLGDQVVADGFPAPAGVFLGLASRHFHRSRTLDSAVGLSFEGV